MRRKQKVLLEGSQALSKATKPNRLTGVLFTWDRVNKNNRLYPRAEAYREFQKLKRRIDNKEIIPGSLDHPSANKEAPLDTISHVLESISWDEQAKAITGTFRLLNTTAGRNAMELIKAGVPIGCSSRGEGKLKASGSYLKVENWNLQTFDLVSNPSNENFLALTESILNDRIETEESYEFWLDNILARTQIESTTKNYIGEDAIDRLIKKV